MGFWGDRALDLIDKLFGVAFLAVFFLYFMDGLKKGRNLFKKDTQGDED